MKQTQEFDGKNIDAAVDKACDALNVTKKQLVYDVISTGSSGIFGIVGVKNARIRVTLPDAGAVAASKAKDTGGNDPQGIKSMVDEAFGEETQTPAPSTPRKKFKKKSPPKKKGSENSGRRPRNKTDKADKAPAGPDEKTVSAAPASTPTATESDPVKADSVSPVDPKPSDPQMPDQTGDDAPAPAPEPVETDRPDKTDKPLSPVADSPERSDDDRDEGYPPRYKDEDPVEVSDDALELGRETLQRMVDLITTDADVTAQRDEDRLLLRVEGGNSGVLIGRRGQTLEAMQFLTDKIINRGSASRVRLKVDIEGYMETRKKNLEALAHKMADKARKTGKPATINQMTAQDRRTVHLALKDDNRVRTQSMGDGYYRRLVIFPKKSGFKKRRPSRK